MLPSPDTPRFRLPTGGAVQPLSPLFLALLALLVAIGSASALPRPRAAA